MNVPDGVVFDFPRGAIVIAGVPFPAGVATFKDPACKTTDNCESCGLFGKCVLGGSLFVDDPGWDRGWSVYVMAENGCLFDIEWAPGEAGLSLHLCAQVATRRQSRAQLDGPTPAALMIEQRRIVPFQATTAAAYVWRDCDPAWLVEHMARVSTFPVERILGAKVTLVAISDLRVRPKGTVLL